MAAVLVEIWSDVVCPWCYIGKRRFATALARYEGGAEVEIVYRAYQLDPSAPRGASTPVREAYAKKFGGAEIADRMIAQVTEVASGVGLEFRLDRALRANTLDAHQLLCGSIRYGAQDALKERLLRAYFTEGLDIGERSTLVRLAGEAGLDTAWAADWLAADAGVSLVEADLREAAARDITAVPSYSIEHGFPIPGAQEPETFLKVLERAGRASQ